MITIPHSLQAEHHEIHEALAEATRVPGHVGEAAKALAATLHPHFERENQIALPPLGLLAPLAAGETPAGAHEVLAMTDELRNEMPRMLEEHRQNEEDVLYPAAILVGEIIRARIATK